MTCCCPHDVSANRLFSAVAHRYRKRFIRRGLEKSQQQLLSGLRQTGYKNATILEIGSGVGHLHQTLLELGASTAVGIDLADKMIIEARDWSTQRGLDTRANYLQGDFLMMDASILSADLVMLDKVVCCYPDAEALVRRSLVKTNRIYALTYPRNRWYVRFGVVIGGLLMRLVGSAFRPYFHNPVQIEAWILSHGFIKVYEATTPVWLSQVYSKTM